MIITYKKNKDCYSRYYLHDPKKLTIKIARIGLNLYRSASLDLIKDSLKFKIKGSYSYKVSYIVFNIMSH